MAQTVIGVFDTSEAAHTAEEKLASRGIDRSALHFACPGSPCESSAPSTHAPGQGRSGAVRQGIRNFFAELFGTETAEAAGREAAVIPRCGAVLAVEVPENAPLEPVRKALLDAGAVDIDERIGSWRQAAGH